MYITLESDYAIRIVNCLAVSGKRMDAKAISESTNVTLRFSLKILRKLVADNIVKSFKGTQGGYELSKSPYEITLKDIVDVTEGEYAFSRCLCGEYTCTRKFEGICGYQSVFREISELVKDKLEAVSIGSIIDG